MATQLNRTTLNSKFSNGERPAGDDFASAWMSFLNQNDDQISYNGSNNNIELGPNTGLVLGNPTAGVTAGTLRFNGSTVQFFDGTNFKDIAGGAGAFVQVGTSTAVAFGNGNVGIGTFASASPPKHLLEIPLGDNSVSGQQVLLGNLVIHNGSSASLPGAGAYIVNNEFLTKNAAGYALFQNSDGATTINGSSNTNQSLSLALQGNPIIVIDQFGAIAASGDMTIGTVSNLHNLTVNGNCSRPGGGSWTDSLSDIRVKKNVRPFKEGLQKLLLFNPVMYNFNGKGGTMDNDKDYVGLIAQDVQKIMPELTISKSLKLNQDDENEAELFTHDLSQLTFMFINAIKELATRIEKLEKAKKNEKRKTGDSSGTDH